MGGGGRAGDDTTWTGTPLDDKDARPISHFLTEKFVTYSVTLFCSLDYTVLSTLKRLPDGETACIKCPSWKCQDHVRKHFSSAQTPSNTHLINCNSITV